jgi:nucleotide-binding universal stress UspA family protein
VNPLNKILVGLDDSAGARDAYALGSLLVEECGEELLTRTGYGPAVSELQTLAVGEAVDVIVVGATHRGAWTRATIGGVGERLPHGAPCAIAVAPKGFADDGPGRLKMIGVAFDGSEESQRALALAAAIAEHVSGTLRVIGVIEPLAMPATGYMVGSAYTDAEELSEKHLRARVDDAVDALPADLRPYAEVGRGDPAEEIIERCKGLDLLVVGSRAHGALLRAAFGSVAAQLAHSAPCPLLVAPRGAEAPQVEPLKPDSEPATA